MEGCLYGRNYHLQIHNMAFISKSYSFSNKTRIISSNINQNFTDLSNGLEDGTKDLNVNDFNCVDLDSDKIENIGNMSAANITVKEGNFSGTVESRNKLKNNKLNYDINSVQNITLDATNTITPTQSKILLSAVTYGAGDTNDVTIDATNNKLELTESGENSAETVTIPNGTYTGANLATAIQNAMNAALDQVYTVTYSGGAFGTYTIASVGNPFWLWVTGGVHIRESILPSIGFLLGGSDGSDKELESHSSDIASQLGFRNKIDTIDATNLKDGTILDLSLRPYDELASYVPIIIDSLLLADASGAATDIVLMRNSTCQLMVRKDAIVGTAKTICTYYSANFFNNKYQ